MAAAQSVCSAVWCTDANVYVGCVGKIDGHVPKAKAWSFASSCVMDL